jgi:hypothetical protein
MTSQEAMSTFCRAEASIMKLSKASEEKRRELTERVRTLRSILTEELTTRDITCMEYTPDGGADPVYFRVKYPNKAPAIDSDFVLKVLTDADDLSSLADKNGHDLPRMLCAALSSRIREQYTERGDKPTLAISNTKERGYNRELTTPADLVKVASELHAARAELTRLRTEEKAQKMCYIEEQKLVEDEVKALLEERDPVTKTARVHMMLDGNEWVYYLRCREKSQAPALGIRKVVPLLEETIQSTLQSRGLGREYSTNVRLDAGFWRDIHKHLSSRLEELTQMSETKSTLTLDRGAPRKRKGV